MKFVLPLYASDQLVAHTRAKQLTTSWTSWAGGDLASFAFHVRRSIRVSGTKCGVWPCDANPLSGS